MDLSVETDVLLFNIRILTLMSEGLGNTATREARCLSTNTVKSHVKNILAKLGASHHTQAEFLPPSTQGSPHRRKRSAMPDPEGGLPQSVGTAMTRDDLSELLPVLAGSERMFPRARGSVRMGMPCGAEARPSL